MASKKHEQVEEKPESVDLGTTGRGHHASEESEPNRTVKPSSRRPLVLVAVILVSIIMVGSILLPSLSAIVSGMQASSSSSSTDAAQTSETAATTNSYMDQLDSRYQSTADSLEAKLESNPNDAAALINLANTYLTWGDMAKNYASTDEENAHVTDLLQKAEGYYDTYLESNDAAAAHVNRALCRYYLGDSAGAISALEKFVAATPDYAPAWANLGMIYQETGDTNKAEDAYNKALEVDPNDENGMKSYVTSQLQSITSSADAATTGHASADAE